MLNSIKTANLTGSISRNAGGLFESVRRLVQTLDQNRLKVCVFGTADEFTERDINAWKPVEVRAFRPLWPKPFGYSPEFQFELERFAPDLTHTHGIWIYPSIATNRYSRRRGIPYMISPHGMLDPWAIRNSRWKKVFAYLLYENAHLHQAHCIRALCESEARAIRECGLKNPIAIIPNGIDLPDRNSLLSGGTSVPASRSSSVPSPSSLVSSPAANPFAAFHASGRKVLLFLSRIHPKKGLPNLIRAWKSVVSGPWSSGPVVSRHDWVLAIAGWDQGGHEAELKRLCDELGIGWAESSEQGAGSEESKAESRKQKVEGLANPSPSALRPPSSDLSSPFSSLPSSQTTASVLFLGPRFDAAKEAVYRDCDAFILPSFSEGVPMAVLEAWAYCKPAVITPGCNLPEAFPRGAAVRIETDPEDIARGLRQFFAMSEADHKAMGLAGRKWMEERYTWSHLGKQMIETYEWLLGGGPAPSCIADF